MERQRLQRRQRQRQRLVWILAGVGIACLAAVAVVVLSRGNDGNDDIALLEGPAPWPANQAGLPERLSAAGLPAVTSMEQLAYHIHSHLDVVVEGEPVSVPPNIGIDPAVGIAVLHTHDERGVIHIEAPAPQDYTLGQFFDTWGVRLDAGCLGGYCSDGQATLRAFVNGAPVEGDPASVVMRAHDEIVLAFGDAGQLPDPIPSRYQFPPGE